MFINKLTEFQLAVVGEGFLSISADSSQTPAQVSGNSTQF